MLVGLSDEEATIQFKLDELCRLGMSVSGLPPLNDALSLPINSVYNNRRVFIVKENRLESVLGEIKGQRLTDSGLTLLVKNNAQLNKQDILVTRLNQAVLGMRVSIIK